MKTYVNKLFDDYKISIYHIKKWESVDEYDDK